MDIVIPRAFTTQLYALHEVPEGQGLGSHLSFALSFVALGGLQLVSRLVGTVAPQPEQHVEF